jgi:hypothetical protein
LELDLDPRLSLRLSPGLNTALSPVLALLLGRSVKPRLAPALVAPLPARLAPPPVDAFDRGLARIVNRRLKAQANEGVTPSTTCGMPTRQHRYM